MRFIITASDQFPVADESGVPGIGPFLSSGVKIDIVKEYRDVGSGSSVMGSLKSGENHG
jgi:hypothetical protein